MKERMTTDWQQEKELLAVVINYVKFHLTPIRMYKNTPAVDEKYSFIRMLKVTSIDFEVTRFSWALYPRPARRRGLTALLLTESVTQPIFELASNFLKPLILSGNLQCIFLIKPSFPFFSSWQSLESTRRMLQLAEEVRVKPGSDAELFMSQTLFE